jgi:hypothetical protein
MTSVEHVVPVTARDTPVRRWAIVSYAYAIVAAVVLGYFLLRIPIQLTDSFVNIATLDRSFAQLMHDAMQPGYMRPALLAELKLVYVLSSGDYFHWFRVTHALEAGLVMLLFVRLLQPRTAVGATMIPLGLAMLIGSHTFAWTVREAFPINTFLTVLLCCAAAANLAFATRRWWTDVLAVLLFIVAAMTVESGLLVGVIFVAGYVVGARGISRSALAGILALFAVYFAARFFVFHVGTPGLLEREAGFGFHRYTGEQLQAMFGGHPFGFYAYNVVATVLNVLFAEPRDGVWRLTADVVQHRVALPSVVNVVASTTATIAIARFAWNRRHAWMRLDLDRRDRIVLLFAAVLAANAVMSFAYTKDVIGSPAGLFYAAAACIACADLVDRAAAVRFVRRATIIAFLAVVSSTWAVRDLGLHAALEHDAFDVREQWAYVDELRSRYGDLDAHALALKRQLQDDAVRVHPAYPPVRKQWTRLFDTD